MQHPSSRATEITPADAGPAGAPGLLMRRGIVGGAVAASATTILPSGAGSASAGGSPVLRTNPSRETIRLGPLSVSFLVTAEDSSGSVAAFEVDVPARQRLAGPAHSHDHYEETIYGISGVLTWTVDGQQIEVGPGQALCIPRGVIHRFDNHGDVDVRALCVVTPAAIGPAFFREAAELLNASAGGPPDVARMIAVMRRHGLTPARP
jgi:quercetin dioxygenase-like cupin family protein